MRCKYCKNTVENGSLYCRFCGSKLVKTDKKELTIPKPKQLKDGRWRGQIMVDGQRQIVYGSTLEEYEINARAVKARLIEFSRIKKSVKQSLDGVVSDYISKNSQLLSPSTIRGYEIIRRNRFSSYMPLDVHSIDFQKMLNDEARECSAKTLKNSWALITAALRAADIPVPDVNLPRVPKNELPWLDFEQIRVLIDAVRGKSIELTVLLALHSLRLSEILALTVDDIYDNAIHVTKAAVLNLENDLVLNNTTKTAASSRTIPIIIPRLLEILPASGRLVKYNSNGLRREINRACLNAGLPQVGIHGLRRSFASLGYHLKWSERSIMLIGGWSNLAVVHNFYIKLAQNDVANDVEKMKNYYEITTTPKKP